MPLILRFPWVHDVTHVGLCCQPNNAAVSALLRLFKLMCSQYAKCTLLMHAGVGGVLRLLSAQGY